MATSRTGTTKYLQNREKLRRRKGPCWICGGVIDYTAAANTPEAFEADHFKPYSQGGTDDIGNLRSAHHRCNRSQGDRGWTPEQNKRHLREW